MDGGATTYADWRGFTLHPPGGPEAILVPTGSSVLDHVLASASKPAAFARGPPRDAARGPHVRRCRPTAVPTPVSQRLADAFAAHLDDEATADLAGKLAEFRDEMDQLDTGSRGGD